MRFVRALWPVVFLIPLSWWADRGCRLAGVDPLYHTTLWIHERLGWFVAVLGLTAELGIAIPAVLYLDIAAPIATTVLPRTILFSRGFIEPLGPADLELVARHEIAHVQRHDATAGVLWHLAFAALLIPGFEPLERRLHARRERAANVTAANGRSERYVSLLSRMSHGADVCAEARLGLEAATRRPEDRWLMWFAPLAVIALAVALPPRRLPPRPAVSAVPSLLGIVTIVAECPPRR